MPKLVCATFDEFEAHLFGFDGRYHLTGPERGEWRSQAFCVERILVQLVSEGAACAYEGVTLHGWATLFVPRSPPQWYRMLGVPMDDRSLIHFAPGQEFRAAVNNANQWLSLSAPAELLQSGIDSDASAVGANRCLDLEPATIAALIKMLDRLASLEATGMLPTKPLSGILEDQLLTLWRFALGRGVHRVSGKGRPAASRAAIFSKAVSLMNRWASREVRIDDLCRAAGVCERTLRAVFNDEVGIGPHQYLQIHRLHRIRRALIAANPNRHTVAGIGARHGYWNGSRLAHDYRALFGELPSETLLRPIPQSSRS
ncbi:AraC family ethanolamine operon transcriptional activator [Lysobacter niabensis]|uniref:AraC family ethanolamine operon transcriptional activator n=1 Tax=Agrilutibacter niabensis TaxID=380628 RepID=A0ABU1VKV7_9GAMM|nr:helix-turn-helix domain-containing protein [Lysobacter niabensis]MDR7098107.1 AraC family ethanolamine operon transcriptional activator [Lysobacter niabensis]